MSREIILDTETTGFNPSNGDRLVEIAALEVIDKKITGQFFHVYINPERDMPNEAFRVHGLSSEFLSQFKTFEYIADDFLNFVQDSQLVIHNAPFDLRFLNYQLKEVGKNTLHHLNVVDTLVLARQKLKIAKYSLDHLCDHFKINRSNRTLHGAKVDTELLFEVYIELLGGRQKGFIDIKASQNKNINSSDIDFAFKVIKANKEEMDTHNYIMSLMEK
jgi:DNA polymerase-3 subunit epsilon